MGGGYQGCDGAPPNMGLRVVGNDLQLGGIQGGGAVMKNFPGFTQKPASFSPQGPENEVSCPTMRFPSQPSNDSN